MEHDKIMMYLSVGLCLGLLLGLFIGSYENYPNKINYHNEKSETACMPFPINGSLEGYDLNQSLICGKDIHNTLPTIILQPIKLQPIK